MLTRSRPFALPTLAIMVCSPQTRPVNTTETFAEGASCRPNFSGAGRRRRRNIAIAGVVLTVLFLGAAIALDLWAPLRLLAGVPAGLALVSGLQVRRNTCVAHAATGRFENEDLTTSEVEDAAFLAASRRVAATIWRDGIFGSMVVALAAAATAWV